MISDVLALLVTVVCVAAYLSGVFYGRMTSNRFSEVKMQYFVRILRIVCFAKKVLVKSTRSGMTLLLASAQKDVNSKLLLVLVFFLALPASFPAVVSSPCRKVYHNKK